MSLSLWVSTGIVITSCVAFVIIGNAYRWDLAARGYARWTRVTGVVALLGISAASAWDRAGQPVLAAGLVLGGIALSVVFVALHRRLTARVREALGRTGEDAGD